MTKGNTMVGDKLPDGIKIQILAYGTSEEGLNACLTVGFKTVPDLTRLDELFKSLPDFADFRPMTDQEITEYEADAEREEVFSYDSNDEDY